MAAGIPLDPKAHVAPFQRVVRNIRASDKASKIAWTMNAGGSTPECSQVGQAKVAAGTSRSSRWALGESPSSEETLTPTRSSRRTPPMLSTMKSHFGSRRWTTRLS